MDKDLKSVQQARDLLRAAHKAYKQFAQAPQEQVDKICEAMAKAGAAQAKRLAQLAHEETGFGRVESKIEKNRFATTMLADAIRGMKTAGIISKSEGVWEIATPMGVVAALVPSTNPTSTAMYKAIISAKARCGVVISPHPRATACTAEALRVVAEAAYAAGAPEGLFGCMTDVSLEGTNALMEHELTSVILATGGGAMVKAAYSKGKPAYGVGSGNVPVYVDRSANLAKAAADILTGTSFDWGTLCSTERTVIADAPIKNKLVDELKQRGGYFLTPDQADRLRRVLKKGGALNVDVVGQSPQQIAKLAGFTAPADAKALIAEVDTVGKAEPLSMETLSPILSFYVEDGWQAGCEKAMEILEFGGIGHTLCLHCTNDRVIEQFAIEKPAMRIVVNSVAALGSVGYTTGLFPAMTLGPGTIGGSITSDNVSPLNLLNVKRMAFETNPMNDAQGNPITSGQKASRFTPPQSGRATVSTYRGPQEKSWIEEIEARLLQRSGNAPVERPAPLPDVPTTSRSGNAGASSKPTASNPITGLSENDISKLVDRFKKS